MSGSISVVIPTYNRPSLTVRAVRSALAQTLSPEEVVVVDDASTDGTASYVEAIFRDDPRVKVVTTEVNAGACSARNAGIRVARHRWVAFLDSDDVWHPEKLAAQVTALEGTPDAVACFTGLRAVRHGRESYVLLPPACPTWSCLLERNTLSTTSCAMFKRSALVLCGGFDLSLRSCQDWDLYLRVLRSGVAVGVRRPLLDYDEGDHLRISNDIEKIMSGHAAVHASVMGLVTSAAGRRALRASHAMSRAEILSAKGGSCLSALGVATRSLAYGRTPDLSRRFSDVVKSVYWRKRISTARSLRNLVPRRERHAV